jgi:hypothetical protein
MSNDKMPEEAKEKKKPISLKFRIGVSLAAGLTVVALGSLQVFLPQVTVNLTMSILIVIMFIPWIQPFVNKIDIPHGVIDLKGNIDEVEENARESGLILNDTSRTKIINKKTEFLLKVGKARESLKGTDLYQLAHEDPALALAGFRIWMEKELRDILNSRGHDIDKKDIVNLGLTLRILLKLEVVNGKEYETLTNLTRLLNRVVHSDINVDTDTAIRTLNLGYSIMFALKERNNR